MKKYLFIPILLLLTSFLIACSGDSSHTTRILMRDIVEGVYDLNDYTAWLVTDDILQTAIVNANENITVDALRSQTRTVGVEAAGTLEITVSDPDADRAQRLSKAIAEAAAAKAKELSTDPFTPPLQVIED